MLAGCSNILWGYDAYKRFGAEKEFSKVAFLAPFVQNCVTSIIISQGLKSELLVENEFTSLWAR